MRAMHATVVSYACDLNVRHACDTCAKCEKRARKTRESRTKREKQRTRDVPEQVLVPSRGCPGISFSSCPEGFSISFLILAAILIFCVGCISGGVLTVWITSPSLRGFVYPFVEILHSSFQQALFRQTQARASRQDRLAPCRD